MKAVLAKIRGLIFVAAVLTSMALCGLKLMKIQIVDGESYLEQTKTTYITTQTVKATRGEIVDANAKPIVANSVSFDVIFDGAFFPSDNEKGNEIILQTANLLEKYGVAWEASIPISSATPYTFKSDASESEISKLKSKVNINVYATAENCIDKLIDDYDINDKYTDKEKWTIAAIRYEMIYDDFSMSNVFTLAENVPTNLVTEIKERSLTLTGVNIEQDAIRQYAQTDIIPHEIGKVGPIYAETYAEYKEKGYSMNDKVGESGIEYAMEEHLRGNDGTTNITVVNGSVASTSVAQEVVPGNTVKLTINSDYQRAVQGVLQNFINYLPTKSSTYADVNSGAIVVLDAKTGAVLALATAPTYTLDQYTENYDELLNAKGNPLINRATDGLYRPGSTFKTITATAGLNEGAITPDSTFYCGHTYKYYDITVNCTGYHGNIAVSRALQVSCNIFFYNLVQHIGIDTLSQYETNYGLGQSLGLESGDSAGYIANPETFDKLGIEWSSGQMLQAAIGQSEIGVTPLQLASVACTIANRGTRYKPYLVDSIWNYDMSQLVSKTEPTVAYQFNVLNDDVYNSIEEGMILASQNTPSGEYSLNGLGYDVAIKTGTPQVTSETDTNSTFIGYAPVGDPKIAFAGIIEGGEYSKYMIRKILDAYYEIYK